MAARRAPTARTGVRRRRRLARRRRPRRARGPAARRAPDRLVGPATCASPRAPFDLVSEITNEPGALARVAGAISDAGVNLAAATCIGTADQVELHVLVPHAEAARHALAITQIAVSREREVVVVEVEDRPGVLADLA